MLFFFFYYFFNYVSSFYTCTIFFLNKYRFFFYLYYFSKTYPVFFSFTIFLNSWPVFCLFFKTYPVNKGIFKNGPAGGQRVRVLVLLAGLLAAGHDPAVRQRAHAARHALDVLGGEAGPRRDQPAHAVLAPRHQLEVTANI